MLIGISDQMGTRFDRLRYEVFQNLILSPMNTGLLRPAVATVLTVYGIETSNGAIVPKSLNLKLQQSLPFTVLKHDWITLFVTPVPVATVLTVYGIETHYFFWLTTIIQGLQQSLPFTVLKPA